MRILPDHSDGDSSFLRRSLSALILLFLVALIPGISEAAKLDKAAAKFVKAMDAKSHMAWADYEYESLGYRVESDPPEVWLDVTIFDGRDYGDEFWQHYRIRVKALTGIAIDKGRGTCSLALKPAQEIEAILEASSTEKTLLQDVPDAELRVEREPVVIGYYSCGLAQKLRRDLEQLRKALRKADPEFLPEEEDEEEDLEEDQELDDSDDLDQLNQPPPSTL